jgi:hypothetical protein
LLASRQQYFWGSLCFKRGRLGTVTRRWQTLYHLKKMRWRKMSCQQWGDWYFTYEINVTHINNDDMIQRKSCGNKWRLRHNSCLREIFSFSGNAVNIKVR